MWKQNIHYNKTVYIDRLYMRRFKQNQKSYYGFNFEYASRIVSRIIDQYIPTIILRVPCLRSGSKEC